MVGDITLGTIDERRSAEDENDVRRAWPNRRMIRARIIALVGAERYTGQYLVGLEPLARFKLRARSDGSSSRPAASSSTGCRICPLSDLPSARDLDADVVVVGGGPSGSAVGILLARWGHRVTILAGRSAGGATFAESLPPSSRKQLGVLGVLETVEAQGFQRNEGNTVRWAGAEARIEEFTSACGFHLERSRLDALLLEAARDAGARIIRGTAREMSEIPGDGRASVAWADPAGMGKIGTRWVLDCSGRSGFLSRQGFRQRERGPSTTALVGVWSRAEGWPEVRATHTLVESYDRGWVWSVPVDAHRRYVAAMIDPAVTPLARQSELETVYRGELRRAAGIAPLLEKARLDARPDACAATPYTSRAHCRAGVLLVGDAGSFLDPLSSHGVRKALASGWLAAVTVNTALRSGGMTEAALALFEERERSASTRYTELTDRFYREAADFHQTPFWARRSERHSAEQGPAGRPSRSPRAGRPASRCSDMRRCSGCGPPPISEPSPANGSW